MSVGESIAGSVDDGGLSTPFSRQAVDPFQGDVLVDHMLRRQAFGKTTLNGYQ